MTPRYLFGPVTASFAEGLQPARASGACRTFGPGPGVDVLCGPTDSWDDLCSRLPEGWRPDLLVLHLPYTIIPGPLWEAPLPLVAFAPDWNLLWSAYLPVLPACSLVLTDTPGARALHRAGIRQARAVNLFGCDSAFLGGPPPEAIRDIHVLFVGNVNPAVQRDRLRFLGRLARLPEPLKVEIHSGVFGPDYRALLDRARIVFNRSIRGECNKRVFEAISRGTLLFMERGNAEVAALFRDGEEVVFYDEFDLEAKLTHYLKQDAERQAVARAAWSRASEFTFAAQWRRCEALFTSELPRLRKHHAERQPLPAHELLTARTWQALSAGADDPALAADLQAALQKEPGEPLWPALLATAVVVSGRNARPAASRQAQALQALPLWERACALAPGNALLELSRVEALVGCGRHEQAVERARQALTLLDQELPRGDQRLWEVPSFPPGFDDFHVDWQRAGGELAGCSPAQRHLARLRLIRGRLHALLATLTRDLPHYFEAVLARPYLPFARAALGTALARAGRRHEALPHLREAVEQNPLDAAAARNLGKLLLDLKDDLGFRRLAARRRRLRQVAPKLVPAEPWAEQAPPTGDELASIVILCCNQLETTRRCLSSLLEHTRGRYELILVDNGSTDNTPAFLDSIRTREGPESVTILRNAENRGYAAGCNQGLQAAHGRWLVLLNNDTVLTPGWLEGLIVPAMLRWPRVGLVGPASNGVPRPQHVPAGYGPDLDGLAEFARQRRVQERGRVLAHPRLSGFCLLLPREVLAKVGPLDERYQWGFFEDDDFCFRVADAGFQLLIAKDVYVHHEVSVTIKGLGLDARRMLEENFGRFVAKWGTARTAGYHLPEPGASGVPAAELGTAQLATVSLCLIVRDEEANIRACLEPVLALFHEIIVVDTGSTDRTREIARELGAKVFDFPWCDSFASARNECLKQATGDWIFWLDADDRVDEANVEKLRQLFAELPAGQVRAYNLKCRCLPDQTGMTTVVDHIRLFPRHEKVRWENRVHEQILPSIRALAQEQKIQEDVVCRTDIEIQHTGYQDPALRGRKLQRDLRLLQLELEERPDHPFTHFNLGSVYRELGRHAEALPHLEKSLALCGPGVSIERKLHALVALCLADLGQPAQALEALGRGRRRYPEDPELLFHEAALRERLNDGAGAEACWLKLLTIKPGAYFASVTTGLTSFKARHRLAALYERQGRLPEAEVVWRAALAEAPDFVPSLHGLAGVLLRRERWPEVAEIAGRLEELTGGWEAPVLRARLLLARKDFAGARALLAPVLEAHPREVYPWLILSHVLLQEGQDLAAAERVLRTVLELQPGHPEAQRNLAVLLRQRGGGPGTTST
jgi:GT2 family glycosyltransferase/Flp pilus assembly protein TadD